MKKIGNRLMLNMQQVSELKVNGPEIGSAQTAVGGFCTTESWRIPAYKF
jgi:hypothetical protein